jgi:hypothetical protein
MLGGGLALLVGTFLMHVTTIKCGGVVFAASAAVARTAMIVILRTDRGLSREDVTLWHHLTPGLLGFAAAPFFLIRADRGIFRQDHSGRFR